MTENEISNLVIGAAIQVHKALGPGLLEEVYKECLYYKLRQSGLIVEKEKPLPVIFEEVRLNCGYRIDLVVEHKVVIEIKSISIMNKIHFVQTLTYLRLGDYRLGLLINFNVPLLKEGVTRVINS